jgi:hypothetical protein
LVFAGGVGERSLELRSKVVTQIKCLGFDIDETANQKSNAPKKVVDITASGSASKVLICPTDEQVCFLSYLHDYKILTMESMKWHGSTPILTKNRSLGGPIPWKRANLSKNNPHRERCCQENNLISALNRETHLKILLILSSDIFIKCEAVTTQCVGKITVDSYSCCRKLSMSAMMQN